MPPRGAEGDLQAYSADPLPTAWFTCVQRFPQGGVSNYVHKGFGSAHEEESHTKIENRLGEQSVVGRDTYAQFVSGFWAAG